MREVKTSGWDLKEVQMAANASISNVKNGFVGTGYYLGIIRSEKLWREDGSASFDEYMSRNYQKDKSWASKCISVYDQFGEQINPGDKPRLRAEYQEYNVSQLFELIYLPEEKREGVTPKTPVKAIRELKPKKEKKVSTVETPEPKKLSAYGKPIKVYPADSLIVMPGCEGGHDCFMCHLQCDIRQEYCRCVEATTGNPFPCEQISRIDSLREEIGERCQFIDLDQAYHRAGDHEPVPCCMECKELCQHACERSIQKMETQLQTCNTDPSSPEYDEEPEPEPVQHEPDPVIDADYEEVPEPAGELRQIGELELSCKTENILRRAGIDTVEELASMKDEELAAVRGMSNRAMEEIRTKLNELESADKAEPEESMTDLQVVRQMLEKENKLLSTCLLTVPDQNDIHIRQMKLKVAALASFVCDLDDIENPPPKPERIYTLEEVAKEIMRLEAAFFGAPVGVKQSVPYQRNIMRLDAMRLLYDNMKE